VHPRYPIYIVPREDNLFMLGATMIENEQRGSITARSMLELLSAAYALHPAFAEAEIVETGVDLRPAYADNLPGLYRKDNIIFVNGLFRHGFLLSPAMARQAADAILDEHLFSELKLCASY
jgi:glycine oxidase